MKITKNQTEIQKSEDLLLQELQELQTEAEPQSSVEDSNLSEEEIVEDPVATTSQEDIEGIVDDLLTTSQEDAESKTIHLEDSKSKTTEFPKRLTTAENQFGQKIFISDIKYKDGVANAIEAYANDPNQKKLLTPAELGTYTNFEGPLSTKLKGIASQGQQMMPSSTEQQASMKIMDLPAEAIASLLNMPAAIKHRLEQKKLAREAAMGQDMTVDTVTENIAQYNEKKAVQHNADVDEKMEAFLNSETPEEGLEHIQKVAEKIEDNLDINEGINKGDERATIYDQFVDKATNWQNRMESYVNSAYDTADKAYETVRKILDAIYEKIESIKKTLSSFLESKQPPAYAPEMG